MSFQAADLESLISRYVTLLGWTLAVEDDVHGPVRGERTVQATGAFDAVAVPGPAGRKTLARLRSADINAPAMDAGHAVALLVAPGTGARLTRLPTVLVFPGTSPVLIPPSPGVHWATPPWTPETRTPLPLPDAQLLHPALAAVVWSRRQAAS
ncbi:hypothetical protein [Streptomyces jumonjinensis]|uniref:hypothetical protein n=1 Tax=Streptomyces jumonjinensis TaxID=1945 RepID=UPI0037AA8D11